MCLDYHFHVLQEYILRFSRPNQFVQLKKVLEEIHIEIFALDIELLIDRVGSKLIHRALIAANTILTSNRLYIHLIDFLKHCFSHISR